MAASERETKIYAFIKEHRVASVDELAREFYASTASIRRDLERLQQQGLVKRTHGGAIFLEKTNETAVHVRLSENHDSKDRVAHAALRHIPEFETVFIDDSSTALVLAEKMDFMHKLVVTNGIQLAMELTKHKDVEVVLPGGSILYNTGMLSGSYTIEKIREFNFDLTITSCTAIDGEYTFERSQDTAILKRTAVKNSYNNLLLFDSQKMQRRAPHRSVAIDDFTIAVTDALRADIPFADSTKCKIICPDA